MPLRRLLLEERLAVDAVGPALHRERPVAEVRHEHGRDPAVVVEEIALRDPALGIEDAVGARQLHLAAHSSRASSCSSPSARHPVGGRPGRRGHDLAQLRAVEDERRRRRRPRSPPGSRRGRAACRPAAAAPRRRSAGRRCPGRKPSPSRIPASSGPNESVTPASNQQIIPALQPHEERRRPPRPRGGSRRSRGRARSRACSRCCRRRRRSRPGRARARAGPAAARDGRRRATRSARDAEALVEADELQSWSPVAVGT